MTKRRYLETAEVEGPKGSTTYGIIELDEIQWAIVRGDQQKPVSYHVFSDSLSRVWKEYTGQDLRRKFPRKRGE